MRDVLRQCTGFGWQLAAMCLTLRGISAVRAFITLGLGGVGQSLNTALIENTFGHMHGFMDMHVFYTGDELRKQAEMFTGKGAFHI